MTIQENYEQAIAVYEKGLEMSLENVEILTTVGILGLRQGDSGKAWSFLEQACMLDSKDARSKVGIGESGCRAALLGVASILQDKSEYD